MSTLTNSPLTKLPDEGDPCSCGGKLHYDDVVGCSCHINPPCNACVDNPLICDSCGATPEEDANGN